MIIDLVHKEYSSFSFWYGKPSSRYFKYCILTLHGPNNKGQEVKSKLTQKD